MQNYLRSRGGFGAKISNHINYLIHGIGNRYLKSIPALFFLLVIIFFKIQLTLYSRGDELTKLKRQIEHLQKKCHITEEDPALPIIYLITPTYQRPVQKAELTRMCHTLLLIPNVHWIIIEDSESQTKLVKNFLSKCGVPYTHLTKLTPAEEKLKEKDPSWMKPRGVHQRNQGLKWLRTSGRNQDGVIYFADDDNTYSLELFKEMRTIKKVGVWPVGLVGGLMVEKPRVNNDGKVEGWDVVYSPKRPFAIDMAGFAVNYKYLLEKPNAKFAYRVRRGHQESEFLRHLIVDLEELEPKAEMCTKVLVWHTRTEKAELAQEKKLKSKNLPPSNARIEV